MAAAKGAKGAAKKTGPNVEYLEQQAEAIRASLAGTAKLPEVFRAAAEAGYLIALADGEESEEERAAVIACLEILSKGFVIEWEAESFLDEAKASFEKEGADARYTAIGETLKGLDHAEAALLLGAVVANASGGLEKSEASALEKIGAAAGVNKQGVVAIVKKARG
jgi:tellurite resistance protein